MLSIVRLPYEVFFLFYRGGGLQADDGLIDTADLFAHIDLQDKAVNLGRMKPFSIPSDKATREEGEVVRRTDSPGK